MNSAIKLSFALMFLSGGLFAQNINNTLGAGGAFNIKDGTTTFLSLSQSSGNVTMSNSLLLPLSSSSALGVIYKGGTRFIHDYQAAGTNGYNTFVGTNAGNFTMSGSSYFASGNTGVGNSALFSLTNGYDNDAFGDGAMYLNTGGYANSAFGGASLSHNTSGSSNAAVGHQSLWANTTGSDNAALGYQSLFENAVGNLNAAFGFESLYADSANENSGFGALAGSNIRSGSNNTCIGYDAQASSSTISNEMTLGNYAISTLRCNTTNITSLSDARDKRNVRRLTLGIDFLMTIKPRLYNWDRRDWYKTGRPDGSKMQKTPTAGFIAQELDAAQRDAHAEWLNLVLKSNPKRLEATPGNLLPVVVKAIQDLKEENDALKHEVALLRASVAKQVKEEVQRALAKSGETKVSLNQTAN